MNMNSKTAYKSGDWAKYGRVMPGCRIKPKVIDQILDGGEVIQTNADQKFTPNKIKDLLGKCFHGEEMQMVNGRLTLPPLTSKGRRVGFYTRNVYFLGGNWGASLKRIEIGADFPSFFLANQRMDIETVLLGIYHYYPKGEDGVTLFVCFSSGTYANRNTNNSAAHVHTVDLLNALKNGVYRRLDKSGNEILVLDTKNFIKHINSLRGAEEIQSVKKDREILDYFGKMFDAMPRKFLGVDCFKEMMAANDKSRMNQGAWEGWYYEFHVRKYLAEHPTPNIVWWSKKGGGELDFDLRFPFEEWFYGDVKSDAQGKSIQGNLQENIDFLVQEKGGRLWYVAIEFIAEKDSDHQYVTTQWWNAKLKKTNPMSYSTRMKYSINVVRMDIYEITQDTIPYLKIGRPSPANGRDRKPKYNIPNKMKEYLRIYERT